MNTPVRHHWWPQLQSGYWTGVDGCINCIDKTGKVFKTQPVNIGVKTHLYSKTYLDGTKDTAIETWLAKQVDAPFDGAFEEIFDFSRIRQHRYKGDERLRNELKEIGYEMNDFIEEISIKFEYKKILSNYIASLLVRTPSYLKRLNNFHSDLAGDTYNYALDNMIYMYDVYREKISQSYIKVMRRTGDNEFIYGDQAVTAQEPWGRSYLPFTIHAPITPDFAVAVMPYEGLNPEEIIGINRLRNRGVSRFNRLVLGDSERFVFSRQNPPLNFIKKNFGRPAPAPFKHRKINGKIETGYDRSKDRY